MVAEHGQYQAQWQCLCLDGQPSLVWEPIPTEWVDPEKVRDRETAVRWAWEFGAYHAARTRVVVLSPDSGAVGVVVWDSGEPLAADNVPEARP
jgi:hypothetical protein